MYQENKKWIQDQKDAGITIIDVGIDVEGKGNNRSPSYQMEKEVVTGESS